MVASRNPVSYILKTSVTRSNSLADNFGAWGGTFSLGSFLPPGPAVPVPVVVVVDAFVVVVAVPDVVFAVGPAVDGATPPGTDVLGAVVFVAVAVAMLYVSSPNMMLSVQQPLIECTIRRLGSRV